MLVKRRLAAGDWDGASRASRMARNWCVISLVLGLFVVLLVVSGVLKNPYATIHP